MTEPTLSDLLVELQTLSVQVSNLVTLWEDGALPSRLCLTLRGEMGRQQFFTLKAGEDFEETVARMNSQLGTSNFVPQDKNFTEFKALDHFRSGDTVFLTPPSGPARDEVFLFNLFRCEGTLLLSNVDAETARQYAQDHKSEGPFRVVDARPPFPVSDCIKKIGY